MHAFVNTQKSIVFKTRGFVIGKCACQRWNLHTYARCLAVTHQLPGYVSSCCVFTTSLGSSYRGYGVVQNATKLNVFERRHCYRIDSSPENCLVLVRHFSVDRRLFDKEPLKPSSKVEETVQALKEDLKEKSAVAAAAEKPPLWTRIKRKVVDEVTHYYHGFRLLFIDLNVSRKLIWRILNGKSLTRREHKLLVRTVSDVFRLVPFSVFIIVPFMEFLLPFAIKLFPGMLPSTFQTATEKEEKMKQALKVKLEMAKFLQQTLDDMAVQGKGHHSKSAKEFTEFFQKVRTSGEQASTEEIMKFSKLFEDEITLDSLSRPQLTALCRVLEIQPIGTNNFLRFQLRMKLRSLAADDKVIQKEGIESLSTAELQQACRARGMRAYGMSEAALRQQLGQWLELSLEKKVPPSLLLLSRALLLPDTIPTSDKLKATISVLPDAVVTQTKAAIGEREGLIDNKTKIEIIKEEVRKIDEEKREMKEEKRDQEILIDPAKVISEGADRAAVLEAASAAEQESKPDTAPREGLSTTDLETLEDALESLSKDKKVIVEKKELDELKEELAEYKEDVDDLQKVQQVMKHTDVKVPEIKESKAAQRLFKKVNSMIGKMDAVLEELEREEKKLKKDLEEKEGLETQEKSEELVSIEELKNAIKQMQKVPDDSLVDRISEILSKMDIDKDGAIRLDHVLKVIELVGKENIKLDKKQIDEIMELMRKEEVIELEEQIEKALEKGSSSTVTAEAQEEDRTNKPTKL